MLLVAGAHAADDPLYGIYALALSILASALGSLPWFWAGRRYGYGVLKLMCRISLSPDGCVRQTETVFERYGSAALLVAKFVPGLARVAPPLAGTFRFGTARFLVYYGAGNALWAGFGLILGFAFHNQIDWLLERLSALGGPALLALLAVLALYVAYRWLVRRQFLKSLRASRIGVPELKDMIARGETPIVLLLAGGFGVGPIERIFEAIEDLGTVSIKGRTNDSGELVLWITDDGVGIAPEDLGQVFQPFVSTKKKKLAWVDSTGLGLSIAHRVIVDDCRGGIDLESELVLNDLAILESRLGKLEKELRVGKKEGERERMVAESQRSSR